MLTEAKLKDHFGRIDNLLLSTKATTENSKKYSLHGAISAAILLIKKCSKSGGKVIVIGNGGSAAIASHLAEDFTKNAGIRTIAFNDAAMITCFANDHGYDHLFEKAIQHYGDKGDVVLAISSSGMSRNILRGVNQAKDMGISVITFSAFEHNNHLREKGRLNFYVPTKTGEYGFAEICHLALGHALIDFICEGKNKCA